MPALLISLVVGCSVKMHNRAPPTDDTSAQRRHEDIRVFRENFLAMDRAFTPATIAAAEQRLSRLENMSASIRPSEFAVELCRIAALADNAHTQCLPNWLGRDICQGVAALGVNQPPWCQLKEPDSEIPDFSTIPISLYPFGEEFHVVGAEERNSDLLGARLVAVEGHSIERIRPTLRAFSGGTPAHRDERAAQVLVSPEQLYVVGLSSSEDSVRYTFLTPDGRRIERILILPKPSTKSAAWRSIPDGASAGWAFQAPDEPFRYRDAPEIDSIVVQLRQHLDGHDQSITDFLDIAERQRVLLGRKNVVLDMRFNRGGNFLLTRDFINRWPKRVPGRFWVLTSRSTFSAAIATIAYLKQAAPDRVTLIGEPVGDRLMFFSDGLPIQLPHSGLFFLPSTVRMDYRDGCRKYDDCSEAVAQPGRPTATSALPFLGELERLPLSISTLEPDIPVPWTIDSWLTGEDPMMEAVITLVEQDAQ